MERLKERSKIQWELTRILDEECKALEFGDIVVDKICALFNYPLTPEE